MMEDISNTTKARDWNETLNMMPEREEIVSQMKKMKDSTPGDDGVRLLYLLEAGEGVLQLLITMIQFMFTYSADQWEDSLKLGLVIALHKKGNINDENNYHGVCLLAMGSRILARVLADRIRIWAEHMELLDEEQAGFRKGRATADVTQIMVRIQEDCVDLKKRMEAAGETMAEDDKPMANNHFRTVI